jgi:hypothetical protein
MLMLRNVFASDLFELGSTSAVIASGLSEYRSSYAREQLLGPLAAGAPLAFATNNVRQLGIDQGASRYGFPEEAAFASTALFTQTPWIGLVAR